jgi:hypothetical protein
MTGGRRSFSVPLEPVRQIVKTCHGTIVIAMARNHLVEASTTPTEKAASDTGTAT